ncbi:ABC transporter permease [Actinoplanes teichomyceticus]|uniref:ABC-2 type transport system permease protein n=1 Tax=Actinoplanes teichomyceticus TaxID=1867 RepID=A0A561VR27_ACTTI|nr:ABC transporter permease [Actinoplanes teichomyceticus]TWG14062.1 ABC-2 type transport system permease protein [Actinoplanes teichomyceticus]GIF16796.1 exporter of polyketide antibiotics [Actinoplanes teichomyceticus]
MTGAGRLLWLVLRRDRVVLPIWVFGLGVMPALSVAGFDSIFATDAERVQYARVSASSAGFVGLYGPLHGDSLGELVVWRAGFIPVMVALMALLTVIRHTRADEEAGRTELIRATAVGRYAPLVAALLATALACVALGLVVAGSMIATGLPGGGSVALGVVFTLNGWFFAGVAAIAAQLTGSARGARAVAVLVLGVAYVLRLGGDIAALGDGRLSWLSSLSPIGWLQRVFPYGENAWWPAVPVLLAAVAAATAAARLLAGRGLGAGLFASRPGPAGAGARLSSPLGLAWRLHRGLLCGWTAGFAALGLVFGAVGGSVAQLAEGSGGINEMFSELGGAGPVTDAYFATVATMCGVIVSLYAVQAALRVRDEEQNGHAELILATSVRRTSWAAGHLLFALLGPALALLAEGALAGAAYGELTPVLGATMIQLPAVWVLAGVTVLLVGVLPRLAPVAWGAVALCLVLLLVGGLLGLHQWVLDLSPFTHVPQLPAAGFHAVPVMVLTLTAAALGVAGLAALRRRDIPA